jgi:hypothetical protein
MLKLAELKLLPIPERAGYVLRNGQYLHYRIQGWCKIDLYMIRDDLNNPYYAELWYYYDLKSVGLVRVFENAPCFEPYIENIKFRLA